MNSEQDSPITQQTAGRRRLLLETFLSVYLPFLIVSAHEREAGGHWAVKLVQFGVSRGYLTKNVGMEDYRFPFVDFLLVWFSAILIFLFFRLFGRFSFTCILLRNVAWLVALAGFPLASVYARTGRVFSLEVVLLVAGATVVLFLWAHDRWPLPKPLNIFLLLMYFAICATPLVGGTSLQGASLILFWPSWWHWGFGIWRSAWLTYPLLGFCLTLLWAAYFRSSRRPAAANSHPTNTSND